MGKVCKGEAKMKETGIIMSGNHPKLILDGIKTQTRRVIKPQPRKWLTNDPDHPGWSWGGGTRKSDLLGTDIDGLKAWCPLFCPYGQVGDRLWVRETHYRWGHWVKNGISKTGRQKWTFKAVSNTVGGLRFPDNNPPFGETDRTQEGWHKRPSIFMPRWASRITLEITEVRVGRVQEITEEDAKLEGVIRYPKTITKGKIYQALTDYHYEAYPLKWGFCKGERLVADYPSLGYARLYSVEKKDGQCIHLDRREAFTLLEQEDMTYQEGFHNLWDSLNAKRGYGWDFNPWVFPISFKEVSHSTR